MTKKMEEQVKQLAKDILAKKDGFSMEELQNAAQKLYEALTIQVYLEKNQIPNTTQQVALDSKSYLIYQDEEPKPVEQPVHSDSLTEPLIEKIKDIVAQMPTETHKIDEVLEEILPSNKHTMNELEDFATNYQQTPVFERKEKETTQITHQESKEQPSDQQLEKPKSLNDQLKKHIQIGLNDRLAFTKHLFNENTNEYNRVISQLTTLHSFDEVKNFINNQVKPDYNWEGKEHHLERLLALFEKKFD